MQCRCSGRYLHPGDQTNAAQENMTIVGLVMLYQCRVIVKSPMLPMVLWEWASILLGGIFWQLNYFRPFLQRGKGSGHLGESQGYIRGQWGGCWKDKRQCLQGRGRVACLMEKGCWKGKVGCTRSRLARAVESQRCVFTEVSSVWAYWYDEYQN